MRERVAEVLRRLAQEQSGPTRELTRLLAAPDGAVAAGEVRRQLGELIRGEDPALRYGAALFTLLGTDELPFDTAEPVMLTVHRLTTELIRDRLTDLRRVVLENPPLRTPAFIRGVVDIAELTVGALLRSEPAPTGSSFYCPAWLILRALWDFTAYYGDEDLRVFRKHAHDLADLVSAAGRPPWTVRAADPGRSAYQNFATQPPSSCVGFSPDERFGFAVCVLLLVETEPDLGNTLLAETRPLPTPVLDLLPYIGSRLGRPGALPDGGGLLRSWARHELDLVVSADGAPPR